MRSNIPITVTLFRDFSEDRRISMEVYADGLSHALCAHFLEHCHVREYRPHIPALFGQGNWRMRLARFGVYPWQARRQQGQINHIVDHGYGHLLYVLDPERTVVTVHDLIPLVRWRGAIPGLVPGRKPWLNLISFNALRRARHLIAISENTRRDLVQLCRCKPERITVVYYGLEEMFRPFNAIQKAQVRHQWNMPSDGTCRILVSGSQFYKNQAGAVRVFARLRALHGGHIQLIKVGGLNPEWTEAVEKFGLKDVTRCITYVNYNQMPEIYNSVELVLFPSLYEGFGRPPLEAMACGTPVVASNAGSLPEVIGDAGVMCGPQDYEGLAQAMYTVLTNADVRQSLIERGLKRASQFTWERTAQRTLEVYERVANGSHS